jgi:hypothetical protein
MKSSLLSLSVGPLIKVTISKFVAWPVRRFPGEVFSILTLVCNRTSRQKIAVNCIETNE